MQKQSRWWITNGETEPVLSTSWPKEPHFKPKKWFDVKSRAKRDVALLEKAGQTGGGPNRIPKLTKPQFKFQTLITKTPTSVIQYPPPTFEKSK